MNKKLLFTTVFLLQINLLAQSTISIDAIATYSEEFTMWIALFGLGLISLFALFLSSEQVKNFKKKHEREEETLIKKHENQDAIISKIGEDIYEITKENLDSSNIAKSENQLLAITTNLIDFLRIKSKKVTIENQTLKLSNLLNDVSGTLMVNTKGKEFELIYDIDQDIAKELNSDTLNISKVLVNILLYCVDNNASQLSIRIMRTSLNAKNDQLSFSVSSNLKIDAESEMDIFSSNYNDDTDEYDSLGLFIAKELSKLMKGDLIARNNEEKNLEFIFSIPYFQEKPEPFNDKFSQTKKLKSKNILIIDSSVNAAVNISSILTNLGHDVKTVDKKEYLSYFEYFDIYDIIFMDEKLFTNKTVAKLENTNSKIIATSNLFEIQKEFPNTIMADAKISKPLTVWQVTSVLNQLFSNLHDTSKITKNGVVNSGTAIVHRNSFQNASNVSLSSFIKFQNKKILLVEDNIINQKVFVGMLGKANMQTTIANHGKEALKILSQNGDFDIIFMDINMPVMDGYTASIKIREIAHYNAIPIIALSALTSSDEIAKMFTSGMNGYMSKPLQKEKLYTVFSVFIENTHHKDAKELSQESQKIIKLDGLNITLGITKSSSSEVFYKEILTEFRDAYGQTDQVFQKLLNDFRYEQLRILCVDIKGLSGSIGAQKLHLIVTDMLKKLSLKKYDYIPELVQQYKKELLLINKSINTYLN
ncbi:MAG: response regulator [Campylobacterota bacterium]|nr:response regulator [Campylobacterota bacterium]